MKVYMDFSPEKCVSKDESRKVLQHVFLKSAGKEQGYLYASNGYLLAKVPVKMDEKDREGIVPVESLKAAKKVFKKSPELEMTCGERVTVKTEECELSYDRFSFLDAPNFERIFPQGKPLAVVALNAKVLRALGDALGAENIILEIRGADRPVVVRPNRGGEAVGVILTVELEKEYRAKGETALPGIGAE